MCCRPVLPVTGLRVLPEEVHGVGQGLAVCVLVQPRPEGEGAVFSPLLLANPIPCPNCPLLLSQHHGVLDVRAGTKCCENQFCLRKAQGSQYFPTRTCLSPSNSGWLSLETTGEMGSGAGGRHTGFTQPSVQPGLHSTAVAEPIVVLPSAFQAVSPILWRERTGGAC